MTKTPTDPGDAAERTEFLGIDFDAIDPGALLDQLRAVTPDTPYGYVVTPNVDLVVRSADPTRHGEAALREIFRRARWCLCDSRVLARLARLCGVRLYLIPGSDLTERLFHEVLERDDVVAIVGGTPRTIDRLRARFPDFKVEHHIAPMGLVRNEQAMREAAAFVAASRARFAFLAVGVPQQELIAREISLFETAGGLALCVGASIEFLTGDQRRAPRIVQRWGLEWAYRLLSDPRRLYRRYLVDGPRILLLAAQWRGRPKQAAKRG